MDNNALFLSKEWFKKGEADIAFARLGFKETAYYGEVCFLCQQAAEKYLKGFLVAHKIIPKKIHSVAALIRESSKINAAFKKFLTYGKILDRYYIPPRQPVPHDVAYRVQDAKEAIEMAESLIELVLRLAK